MTLRGMVRLMSSIIEARVVDLPVPTVPVTRTRPRGRRTQIGDEPGRLQLLHARHPERHLAERHRDRAPLLVEVGAESGEARHREREIDLVRVLEVLPLSRGEDLLDDGLDVLAAGLGLVQGDQPAVHADRGGSPRLDVQVGRAGLVHALEDMADVHVADLRSPRGQLSCT